MKKITAFIKPFKLYDVRKALESINVQGMSVTESRGYGRQNLWGLLSKRYPQLLLHNLICHR